MITQADTNSAQRRQAQLSMDSLNEQFGVNSMGQNMLPQAEKMRADLLLQRDNPQAFNRKVYAAPIQNPFAPQASGYGGGGGGGRAVAMDEYNPTRVTTPGTTGGAPKFTQHKTTALKKYTNPFG